MKAPIRFGDFVEVNPRIRLEKGKEYPYVEMAAVNPGNAFIFPEEKRVYKGGGSRFQSGDTLFARITPCLENGKIVRCKYTSNEPCFGSTEFFIFRGKSNVSDSTYIFYLALSPIIRDPAVKSMTGASGRQRAILSSVEDIHVPAYSLPTQRKIVAVLSAYDDLIENNTRRIRILEDMAQTLYQEWFVHFRFPGHENVPIVESPLGPIPHGWEVKQIKGFVDDYIGGGWGKEKKDSKYTVPAYVIRGTDLVHVRHIKTDTCPLRFHTQSNFKSRQLEADDIVMEISGGGKDWGVGRSVLVTPQMVQAFEEPVICASFCKRLTLNSKIYSPLIFMMYLQEAYNNKDLEQYELRSTGIRNFQFKTFLERGWIPVPSPSIQKQFVVKAQSLIDSIQNIGARNANLRQTRDLLLPKLISGEIDVSELDIDDSPKSD